MHHSDKTLLFWVWLAIVATCIGAYFGLALHYAWFHAPHSEWNCLFHWACEWYYGTLMGVPFR